MLSNAKDQAPDAPPAEGTLGWLMLRYFASNAFKKLDPITQRTKRSILEKAAAEPTKPGGDLQFKHIPLSVLEPKHVKIMRDRKKDLPGAANNRVSEMRVLLSWGLEEEDEHVKRNVAKDVKMLDYKEKAFHQWTESELDKFEKRHPRGAKAHLALAIMLYLGVRKSDAVRLGPPMVKNGWITFKPQKTRTST